MLPEHGQTWLSDAAGRRYTSELRIAAVDPEPWRPGVGRYRGHKLATSGSVSPEPPISLGMSRNLGRPSRIGSTFS